MKIEVYSPTIRRKEMDAVLTAMVEEKIGPGDRSRILIQTAKEQIQFDYALALRSPAVALHLALSAVIGQAAGTETEKTHSEKAVIISALSPRYYLNVIKDLQLTPLFCDVSYDFPSMSRQTIENVIAAKPDGVEICAIVLHHTLGFIPDSASIAELGFPVIEDISQSYGNKIKAAEKLKGCFCILGLEEKDMLTSGGGSLLFAMNRRDSTALRNFSGIPDEYCLPDINAALATVQFKELHRNIEKRRGITSIYTQASMRTRHKRFIHLTEDEYNHYAFALVLETGLKDVVTYARKKEIIVESAFDKTIAGTGICENCPVSNSLTLRTVLFPLYPRLHSQEAERVSRLIMTLP